MQPKSWLQESYWADLDEQSVCWLVLEGYNVRPLVEKHNKWFNKHHPNGGILRLKK
jgi:hypothetical protein